MQSCQEDEAKTDGGTESLTIKVKDQDGEETLFRIKYSTPMIKVFTAYATNRRTQPEVLRFLCDGSRILPDDTPTKLGLEDQDMIQVVLAQNGGVMRCIRDYVECPSSS